MIESLKGNVHFDLILDEESPICCPGKRFSCTTRLERISFRRSQPPTTLATAPAGGRPALASFPLVHDSDLVWADEIDSYLRTAQTRLNKESKSTEDLR
jgi:hypothetical protein